MVKRFCTWLLQHNIPFVGKRKQTHCILLKLHFQHGSTRNHYGSLFVIWTYIHSKVSIIESNFQSPSFWSKYLSCCSSYLNLFITVAAESVNRIKIGLDSYSLRLKLQSLHDTRTIFSQRFVARGCMRMDKFRKQHCSSSS